MSSVDERVAFTVLGYNVHGSTVLDVKPDVELDVVPVEPAGGAAVVVTGTVVLGAFVVVGPALAGILEATGSFGPRGAGGFADRAGRVGGAALAGLACATPPRTVAPNTPALKKYNICRRLTSAGFDDPPLW
jgi:hypothetical protein